MNKFVSSIKSFLRDEDGASMGEYALLLGVITVALIAVIALFKNEIANLFNTTTNTLGNTAS